MEKPPMGSLVVSSLKSQGVKTQQPFLFDFYFYLPTQADADGLAAELRPMGYQVDVRPGADDVNILCLASKLMVPVEAEMNRLGDTFEALAAKYHGEFDGWETGVD